MLILPLLRSHLQARQRNSGRECDRERDRGDSTSSWRSRVSHNLVESLASKHVSERFCSLYLIGASQPTTTDHSAEQSDWKGAINNHFHLDRTWNDVESADIDVGTFHALILVCRADSDIGSENM